MKKQILMIPTIGMLMIACFTTSPVIGSGYSSTSSGNILYVGGSGPGNYSKIQYAIGNATDGDTIFVYNGTYYENVYIYKQIQLIGENRNNTIINASGDTYCILIAPDTPGVTVEKFTLEDANWKVLWIANHSDWVVISDCIIKGSYDNYDLVGISIENTLNATIENCVVVGNMNGLIQIDSNGSIINNCYFSNLQHNIHLQKSGWNKISNCRIVGPSDSVYWNGGIDLNLECSINQISNCQISGTVRAISFFDGPSWNVINDCVITNNEIGVDIFGNSHSNFVFKSELSNNYRGVVCEPSTYGNYIYHNSFIDNTVFQAQDFGDNIWDEGYPSGGNSWSDYTGIDRYNGPDQNINGSDGIGDEPYNISENNADRYPLVPLDEEAPEVEIIKPISGLYMNDKLVRKYFLPRIPLIIGTITIGFNASDNDSGVYRVEIFIDDESRGNITSEPYNFTWTHEKISLFKHKHTIKVVAYDYAGNNASDEITVRKFL